MWRRLTAPVTTSTLFPDTMVVRLLDVAGSCGAFSRRFYPRLHRVSARCRTRSPLAACFVQFGRATVSPVESATKDESPASIPTLSPVRDGATWTLTWKTTYHLPFCRVRMADFGRSEEHTSELQSLMRNSYAVFCLKKKHTN